MIFDSEVIWSPLPICVLNGELIRYSPLYLDTNYFIVAPPGTDRRYVITIPIQVKLLLCARYFQKSCGIIKFREADI